MPGICWSRNDHSAISSANKCLPHSKRNNVDVRLSTTVQSIQWNDAEARNLMLSDGQQLQPQQVVIAVPWHAVTTLPGGQSR